MAHWVATSPWSYGSVRADRAPRFLPPSTAPMGIGGMLVRPAGDHPAVWSVPPVPDGGGGGRGWAVRRRLEGSDALGLAPRLRLRPGRGVGT
ncbi:hypothetical protein Sgou_61460 [Streptomyces gougerotii]|uniref:Uncharacterized protein n=1 Tax=Streptomyces gougerotii TaxID=53448 RepID=A0A6A0CZB8_9ACTN|nr:hypothetical protein Sgou_05030 [Streptomyces gougerotii]GFH81476.1 hypothetical protein Sgou_61460 [Streptomyces gougerotii]GGU92179.1 hypothetical protein GCM10010227_54340 [Streptomyces gougerotii]